MSISIRMYPLLKDEMIESAGVVPEKPELYYHGEDGRCLMELRDTEGEEKSFSAIISDPRCAWYPESHEIHLKQDVTVKDVSGWFGPEGVAPANSTLGLALHWSSTGSEMQGISLMTEVSTGSGEIRAEGKLKFPKGYLKGSIIIELVVYLKKPGKPEDDEKQLCNVSGAVLGKLMQYQLYIDGNGSTFPIGTENCPGKPLWRIKYEPDEIMTDSFDYDNVGIVFNTAHRDYHLINQDSQDYSQAFFSEVLSDALIVMMEILKQSAKDQAAWDDILAGDNYEAGSIAAAMNYFMIKLGWNTDDLLSLSESVHVFIDKNLKGDVK